MLCVANRQFVEGLSDLDDTVLVSFVNPGSDSITTKNEFKDVVETRCHDTDSQAFSYEVCTAEDAQKIAKFVVQYKDVQCIICQCEAGISRSSGCAAAIMKFLTGSDKSIFDRSQFSPNKLIYRLVLQALTEIQKD